MKLPDLAELVALRGGARAAMLRAHGPSRALLQGSHRSAQRGLGLEFEEVRPYVAGDDARSIDWRVTARRGRLHTKLYREERERPVWLLIDLQPGMFFGSRTQLKSAAAVRAAALLAWIGAAGGDRVGAVIGTAGGALCLPPRSREAGVLAILGALIAHQPRAPAAPAPGSFAAALEMLLPLVHPGSLVLALSDFADAGTTALRPWSRLAAHAECRLFWVTDGLEERGLPDGIYRGGLPQRPIALDGAGLRSQWLAAWGERETRLRGLCESLDLTLTRLDTLHPVEKSLQPSTGMTPAAA